VVAPPSRRFPRQGELWWFDPDPVRGSELGKKVRPALVVSVDPFNESGPKAVVVPGTTQNRANPFHVPFTYRLRQAEVTTYFCCDNVRAVDARVRLLHRMAPRPVPSPVMDEVQRHLRMILGL
jgi:mRNA interferase MazF